MRIIKDRAIVGDTLVHVAEAADLPAQGDLTVSLNRYRELRGQLRKRGGKVGVRLAASDDAKLVAQYLPELALVAIEFPSFKDGRGYSTARLLRERYKYQGEIRAIGDVMRDQLFFMERCGFNAFELKEGKDVDSALLAFSELSVTYQGAADDARPLFRRRQG